MKPLNSIIHRRGFISTIIVAFLIGATIIYISALFFSGEISDEKEYYLIFTSAFLTIIPICRYIISAKKDFNLFSPYFLPLAIIGIIYIIPSVFLSIVEKKPIFLTALVIQIIGVFAYLFGLVAWDLFKPSHNVERGQKIDEFLVSATEKSQKITMKIILTVGLLLLTTYGFISNVTISMLKKISIEDLRRTAEIGKGFIKEPGVFFVTTAALWLAFYGFLKRRVSAKKYFLFVFIIAFFLFVTTGHKAPVVALLLLAVGLYGKYNKVSFLKVIICVLLLFLIIISMNSIRSGDGMNISKIAERSFALTVPIYEMNYLQLVWLVKKDLLKIQFGNEYLQNSMIIIPRFLWQNKPISFDYSLKQLLKFNFLGGGAPPTMFGSLYINFGLYGVFIGMFIIGVFYKYLYGIYLRSCNLLVIIPVLYLMLYLLDPSTFSATLLLVVIFMIFVHVLNRVLFKIINRGNN